MASLSLLTVSLLLSTLAVLTLSQSPPPIAPRPNVDDLPTFARWLVSQSAWGVLSTLTQDHFPFGNIISFADAGTGVPYFYLSPALDPTGMNAVNDSRASFALSEALLGFCANADPQSPSCAKITLSGNLKLLKRGTAEEEFGREALFAKHPQLTGFPLMRNTFEVFKMIINDISLVTKRAPRVDLPINIYFDS